MSPSTMSCWVNVSVGALGREAWLDGERENNADITKALFWLYEILLPEETDRRGPVVDSLRGDGERQVGGGGVVIRRT